MFPFFMNNIGIPQGWNFSAVNSAMLCNNPFDMGNVLWNLGRESAISSMTKFWYPSPELGGGMPFSTMSNYDFLLNPELALAQTKYDINRNNSVWGWGNNGFDVTNPWGDVWSRGNDGNNSSNSSGTSKDPKVNEEYTKLKKLFDTLISANKTKEEDLENILTDDQKAAIQKALKEGKTTEEKLQALKDLFNEFDDKDLLRNAAISSDPAIKKALIGIGYEFSEDFLTKDETNKKKTKRELINAIYTELDKGNIEKLNESVAAMHDDIIEFTALWKKAHTDKSVLTMVAEHLPNKKDERGLWKNSVQQLSQSLIDKADKVIGSKDMPEIKADKDALQKALSEAIGENGKGKIDSDTKSAAAKSIKKVAEAYDKLYESIRKAELEKINSAIKNRFGFLDEIGLSDEKIIGDNFAVKPSDSKTPANDEGKDEVVGSVHGSNKAEKAEKKKEKEKEETAKDEESYEQTIVEEDNGPYDLGYSVAEDLIGKTTADEYKSVEKALKCITKDNVEEFLQGYYSNDSGGNGLFLQIATENNCTLKRSDVNKVMKAALDAVDNDLRDTKEFKEAQRIYRKYERKKDGIFKLIGQGAWGWNRFWGKDDLDQFDDALEKLFGLNGKTKLEAENDKKDS